MNATNNTVKTISSFYFENNYLSNFFESPVEYNGKTYRCAEGAYQAQKNPDRADEFTKLKGSDARKLGKSVELRSDWSQVKDGIMVEVVNAKFQQNRNLMKKLVATGDAELVHGNSWGDTYWGWSGGKGLNKLGEILMNIRKEEIAVIKHQVREAIDYKDAIADAAFEPNCQEEKRPKTQRQQLRYEAGDDNAIREEKAAMTLADILAGKTIESGYTGKPEDGEHIVKLIDEPQVFQGRNGVFVTLELRDETTKVTWKAFVNADELVKKLAEISFNNKGMLGGMNAQKALLNIQKNPFRCWAVEDTKGATRTYFDEERANRALYYVSQQKAKEELYQLRKKESEDAEAAQKEAAELTKKAKEENNDLPFDM